MNKAQSPETLSFAALYRTVFLAEHTHPMNIALHVAERGAGRDHAFQTFAACCCRRRR